VNIRMKRIPATISGWIIGSLAGAGIMALFGGSGDKNYWPTVFSLSFFLLTMLVCLWIRDEQPKRRRGLWIMALVVLAPSLILLFAFGPAPALGTLVGSLTAALIITWRYLTGKEAVPTSGG
jgi:peptidoglycan/LPS O-acetylase OafA/YrhL